ncbi:tetratricopeptide repeat protein [Nostoc linckia z18]|jgi:tetratricopeptide (TPR) repeat protein|uniref:Tetratricopeptide repeat protein n=3 Tax=Nostoc TaxID=1177 RepID=A0A9Q6EJ35_NOSLI|nr:MULTISPECIES: tetratricopeptide repeat protein [Nostoc]MBL1199162.1 tetratricopeptide repeat protein [Nostoc sp. GBBB01]MDZ8014484.1 tetratricopeptide repeat protein [Nostoc sp. ZfuVER08]PHK40877.1 tetratricopeptide repeat protein [Nostoc linckia z15]PHK46420.1 tetratricopeptide repeat protein [Nostoc linckia z16]MBC1238127.1 tetratricopeptide repeat protein [Nostoc sp. 2RC]
MDSLSINSLLEELKNPDATVREQATRKIWRIWFQQKGIYGLERIDRSQKLLDAGEITQAETALTELLREQPDFAEAWNRRAFLYYSIGDYQKSLADCQMVVQINPIHFGALHGMGLCYAALGRYSEAIRAFKRALEIQPYSLVNQKLILECTFRLSYDGR